MSASADPTSPSTGSILPLSSRCCNCLTVEATDGRRHFGETRIGAYGAVGGVVFFVIYSLARRAAPVDQRPQGRTA